MVGDEHGGMMEGTSVAGDDGGSGGDTVNRCRRGRRGEQEWVSRGQRRERASQQLTRRTGIAAVDAEDRRRSS